MYKSIIYIFSPFQGSKQQTNLSTPKLGAHLLDRTVFCGHERSRERVSGDVNVMEGEILLVS